jgi:hypothetical protein
VAARLDERAARLHRRPDRRGQLHPLLPDLQLSPADAAHVQQVVDQPHHHLHLPLHRLARLVLHFGGQVRQVEQIDRRLDRRQGIAQFVRQRQSQPGRRKVHTRDRECLQDSAQDSHAPGPS